ncbi:MAG: tRNA uridine-5-carboxymethylaminomethyl(34) synthesis enzyme MnmG [Clostridia bacterium]|jgi:tRNA uridine 5-carboxymethylaminomethyl modification enzyme|nr:tRNA uridine-5-carboxymethylaminomethyl(34) synthesis enzyme MnmG [Clostridia bacterium]
MADIVVIGAGHAGCEAALAAARMGIDTLLLTLNMDGIALMACNPVIGGSAKGHLVRELDALGGEMGLAIDDTFLQSRMLNMGKGPAVHSLRAQADKQGYQNRMRRALMTTEHLTVRQGEAASIETENGRVTAVTTVTGARIPCRAIVAATGVYLKGSIIIGEHRHDGGPQGLMNASELSASLQELGFELRRYKTGTPARVDVRTIDFDEMEEQKGDEPVIPFSFLTDRKLENTYSCYLTWTTQETHRIILDNLHRAPLYSGKIHGIGPRYCPSIEDKVVRFADKERHQIFLEPEGKESREWYVQGMSTSMPEDVQWAMYRTIPGLRRCEFTRLGYAIEYDCIDSRELRPTLESLRIGGLFCAGQINGTSGYEEAACQGLLAGMNAALTLQGKEPVILTRDMAYIGVLTDDLTTKGTDEPYRMMTSRAEHRLYLRQDNADLRLTEIGHKAGLAGEERLERTRKKREETEKLLQELQTTRFAPGEALNGLLARKGEPEAAGSQKAEDLLKRPGINLKDLAELHPEWAEVSPAAAEQAEISVKYAGYLEKQEQLIRRARALEETRLSPDIPYEEIEHLRLEARQKLAKQKPVSLGAAGRIPGVNPADVAVLEVWLRTREHNKAAGS